MVLIVGHVVCIVTFLKKGCICYIFSHRGILTIAWSMADPELLLSCGKDAKILCSNPNTGEVLLPSNFHCLRMER